MHRLVPEILMAEDSADDAELTIAALAEYNLANTVVLAPDGAEALDYLYRRGRYAGRLFASSMALLNCSGPTTTNSWMPQPAATWTRSAPAGNGWAVSSMTFWPSRVCCAPIFLATA